MKEEDLPKHKGELSITHNGHKSNYETIQDYTDLLNADDEDWATPTSKEIAIKNDELWEMQWYPNTPIGFNKIYGATLEEIITKSKE